jgi:hypothetical protein
VCRDGDTELLAIRHAFAVPLSRHENDRMPCIRGCSTHPRLNCSAGRCQHYEVT